MLGDRREAIERCLIDFASMLKSIQLYPASSPVVKGAAERSLGSLQPLLREGRLVLEVYPEIIRVGEDKIGAGSPPIRQLAARLHAHGVARLHIDRIVDAASFQRFWELMAGDRQEIDERGGLEWALSREVLRGLQVDLLKVERVFDSSAAWEPDDVWAALLRGFQGSSEAGEIDWGALSSNVDKLAEFVEWMLTQADRIPELAGYSQTDILKLVCERVGEIAAVAGSDQFVHLVLAVRALFEKIDPDALVELLAEPMISEPLPDAKPIDITGTIAGSLTLDQVQTLVAHSIRTQQRSSPRLYRLFDRLLQDRDNREDLSREIRDFLDQQVSTFGSGEGWVNDWPRLTDVLNGEVPQRFISPEYESTLQQISLQESPVEAWPVERIRPLLEQMEASAVLRRKRQILLAVLGLEEDDSDYRTLAAEVAGFLPDLLLQGDYALAEQALQVFADHCDLASGRSEAQRKMASDVLDQFYDRHTLRQLVLESIGRVDDDAQVISKIFQIGGPSIIAGLLETLAKEDSRRVRQRLVTILSTMGEQVVQIIRRHLDDSRWYFVRNLVLIIGEVGNPSLIPSLESTLAHEDARVRRETVLALMGMPDDRAGQLLLKATDDPENEVRLYAIYALGRSGRGRPRARLEELIRLPNWRGQNTELIQTAAIALGRLGNPSAIQPLVRLSEQRAWLYRARRAAAVEAAAWAVGALMGVDVGPPPEIPRLNRLGSPRKHLFRR